MLHESDKIKQLDITESTLTFSEIYNKPYFPKELDEDIKKSNLLLLPHEGFRDFEKPVFPEQTMEFFNYVKAFDNENFHSEICISDDDYYELELHSALITIPTLILDKVVLPLAISIIASYALELKQKRKKDVKIKVNMTVVDGEKSKNLSYEGDSENLNETLKAANDEFFNS
ncbi:hypothetical protein [Bacillus sp. SM2101]|uniref:hypothetical protein n=1 Tax=Bacillus sp. SM2101 TaxID=2805366 RepID=UPI001BDEDEA8|nr:hypothetical protein [Bacillus sp. SM2101]